MFEQIKSVVECGDSNLNVNIEAIECSLLGYRERARLNCPSLLKSSYDPFLSNIRGALDKFKADVKHRLAAKVVLSIEGRELTRKLYPLHEPGRPVTISIPIANLGPGTAKDVRADLTADEDTAVSGTEISIGDLPPGPFDLAVQIMMIKSAPSLDLHLRLSWTTPGHIAREETITEVVVRAQRPDVMWDQLLNREPYSTEVAEGPEFVGRREKIIAVASRLLTQPMRSSYITGQKRVGKTSLAKAVAAYIDSTKEANFKFVYMEWGSYARRDPDDTVSALGKRVASELQSDLPADERISDLDFHGTLAPLIDVAQNLRAKRPTMRFVVMLDEFDEIHQEMYRIGQLAEVLFSNLRTLASQRNLALILVGGEKMPFVIAAQGDQLNKFVRESLDYFSSESEWREYCELVEKPTENILSWRRDAIRALFGLSFGHPYYTKLICARVFQNAVSERDSDVTIKEIFRASSTLMRDLDVNAFAHYWKDGIPGDKDQEEALSSARAKYLAAVGRLMRLGQAVTPENISTQREHFKLDPSEIFPLTREFSNRGILKERGDTLEFVVPFFGYWLREVGVDRIVVDKLSEEISDELRKSTETARVSAGELADLVKPWSPYRGQEITAEKVRSWLDQVPDPRDQRILFKLLQNLRLVSEIEIRSKLRLAFSMLTPRLPPLVRRSRATYRSNIAICYVDGQGKSGHYYASRFAEENEIYAKCVTSADKFTEHVAQAEKEGNQVAAVAIIDDIVATGCTLSKHVVSFVSAHKETLAKRKIFVAVISLLGTVSGESKLRRSLENIQLQGIDIQMRICEPISARYEAFTENNGIWSNNAELHQAKALCTRLGAQIYGDNPLGYGKMALLILFPETCPNNSLPILHSAGKSVEKWEPLFPRPVN